MPSLPGENRGERLREFENRSVKTQRHSRGFSPAQEFSQTLPRLSTGYKDTENMFYFIIKLLFSDLTKKNTIYEVRI